MNLEKFYFPDDNTLNFLAVLMVVLGFTLIAMLCTIAIKDKKEFKEMIKEDSKPVQKIHCFECEIETTPNTLASGEQYCGTCGLIH